MASALVIVAACGGQSDLTTPDAGDAASEVGCAGRLTSCNGACVDLLTDDANCGGCGLACSTTCTMGRCVETLATTMNAVSVATDGAYVYWSSTTQFKPCGPCATIQRVPVGGGAPTTLAVADPATIAEGPIADSNDLVWMTSDGAILKLPLGGGTPTKLATESSPPMAFASGIVVHQAGTTVADKRLDATPTDGGASVTFATVDQWSFPWAMATDGTTAFYALNGEASPVQALYSSAIAPNAKQVDVSIDSDFASELEVDSSFLYIATGEAIERVQRDGEYRTVLVELTPCTSMCLGSLHPISLAFDEQSLYFNDTGVKQIERVATAGGPVTMLAGSTVPDSPGGRAIAVDSKSVYWTTGSAIMKVTPK
jgi:hypothetical protein